MTMSRNQPFFSEEGPGASHREYWAGFLFMERVARGGLKTQLDIRNAAKTSIEAADIFLEELERQKPLDPPTDFPMHSPMPNQNP